jgi:hypothetical protein
MAQPHISEDPIDPMPIPSSPIPSRYLSPFPSPTDHILREYMNPYYPDISGQPQTTFSQKEVRDDTL